MAFQFKNIKIYGIMISILHWHISGHSTLLSQYDLIIEKYDNKVKKKDWNCTLCGDALLGPIRSFSCKVYQNNKKVLTGNILNISRLTLKHPFPRLNTKQGIAMLRQYWENMMISTIVLKNKSLCDIVMIILQLLVTSPFQSWTEHICSP